MTELDVMADLYSRLNTVPNIVGVFDSKAPANTAMPYIVISSSSKYDGRLLNNTEKRLNIQISVYTSYKGKKQAYQISQAIYNVLEIDYDFISEQVLIDPITEGGRAILTYEYYYESSGGNK